LLRRALTSANSAITKNAFAATIIATANSRHQIAPAVSSPVAPVT
jgi:hypothetical protein